MREMNAGVRFRVPGHKERGQKERRRETSMSAAIESFWRRRVWFAIIMGLNQGSESVVKRQDF